VTPADDLSVFSADYETARTRFLEAAAQVGARLAAFPVAVPSTGGQPLTIDVAVVPGNNCGHVVVVTSGLHGVEGFFGSAVQLAWLRAMAARRATPPPGDLVLVHALNPYGFQRLRRADADNIDLNRNFLSSNDAYAGVPAGYEALAPLLNPPGPPTGYEAFWLRALVAVCRHGLRQLKAVTAVGQYEYPQGLFFGGRQAAETTNIVRKHFRDWIGESENIVHVDLHTGLGPSGHAKLLLVEPPDAPELSWYAEQFGGQSIEPLDPASGIAYAARGTMGGWLRGHLADRRYRFVVAEFGTHALLRVFAALRAENRAFHGCDPDDPRLRRAQAELVECFCPASHRWRRRALSRGLEIIATAQQAADSLAEGKTSLLVPSVESSTTIPKPTTRSTQPVARQLTPRP